MIKLTSFNELKSSDKIISPIDNEVTGFKIDNDGEKYLMGETSSFPIFQFDPNDFYIYTGTKEIGEVDNDFFVNMEKEQE